jgi:HK97 family phage prohead protease
METRSFKATFETRTEDKEHRVLGRPVIIGEETDLGFCREIIEPGALDKTDLDDVLFFTNHDINKIPLARSRRNNGNSTMKIETEKDGISVDARLDTENNSEARALFSAIERGDMTGMSFMFVVPKEGEHWEEPDGEKPLRRITKIDAIIEVSAVNFPAYAQTELSVRDNSTLENVKRSLENARAARELENSRNGEQQLLELAKAQTLALARRL